MSQPTAFGMIHDLTHLEYQVRRTLQSAQADVYNARQYISQDLEQALKPEQRELLLGLLANASASLKLVIGA
jgi:hypothetical protein